ncbi:MAG: class I SAM-dependent methyltransferase [Actinomycetota bacterium]|nr:class I SAM-dependent methyltransferase [Actinomycetota bacterium]
MAPGWDGEEYQRRFDELRASGTDVHGEADFVRALRPASVLDAGCGTGRVAIELAAHGIDVVGVDVDDSMLAAARRRQPDLTWVTAELGGLDLGRTFDVVVMAGNVLLFTAPGSHAGVVAACGRHLGAGGCLVTGFELGRDYGIDAYERDAVAAGLERVERWSTWDCERWDETSRYAVSVHRRPS